MLAIEIRFIGGSYHSTPWGRHVNEADLEWPPSPWRIIRSMIAIWHRKLDYKQYPKETLECLISTLTGDRPGYRLPKAVHAHTRHYMPVRSGKTDKNVLIFDAFLRISPEEPLIIVWPEVELSEQEMNLLDALLENLGFLGRAESWVEACRLENWDNKQINCAPGNLEMDLDTGEQLEPVRLLLPQTNDEYSKWRESILKNLDLQNVKPQKKRQLLLSTIPERLWDALSLETGQIRSAGWSRPPGSTEVLYQRPRELMSAVNTKYSFRKKDIFFDTCRFVISGKTLPLIEDALRVGEWMRLAVMGRAKRDLGEDGIPFELSGHAIPQDNDHGHAFFLPEDSNKDGWIDHILVHAPAGFSESSLLVLNRLSRIWNKKGQEWELLFEAIGEKKDFSGKCSLCFESYIWISITPYLHPWHLKKKFNLQDQVLRECKIRSFPEPEQIEIVPEISIGRGQKRRPVHFHRFRSKKGLIQPDTKGSFLRLAYPEPVQGPLALGFGCHFGLGMFAPEV